VSSASTANLENDRHLIADALGRDEQHGGGMPPKLAKGSVFWEQWDAPF